MPGKSRWQPDRPKAQQKRDEYTVVLEEIREQFKTLAEGAVFDREQQAKRDLKLSKIDQLTDDMEIVKTELKLIRREQVIQEEFDFLERRVAKIERKLAVRRN